MSSVNETDSAAFLKSLLCTQCEASGASDVPQSTKSVLVCLARRLSQQLDVQTACIERSPTA